MLCRVCGFRVRVWESYRTCEVSGTGMDVLQKSQKFRVLWHGAYRAYRSSGYGYECPTELTEVPGTGVKVLQNFQKYRALWHGPTDLTEVRGRYKNAVPVPRVFVVRAYRAYRSSGYRYFL